MPRTTVNIEGTILEEIRAIRKRERRSMGRIISELLAEALAQRGKGRRRRSRLKWISKPMGARIDLEDKEALYAVLDRDRR